MLKIKSATRLALTLGVGCASLIWLAIGVGIIPNPHQLEIDKRISLTKSVAVNVATFAENRRTTDLAIILERTVQSEQSLNSIGVRRPGRENYFVTKGPHEAIWDRINKRNDGRQIEVQILANNMNWGTLEMAFEPVKPPGLSGFFMFPFGLIAFVAASMTLLAWAVLGKTFKYLNPTKVVPDRVKSALDTLAEGLVLISPNGEIAHSNEAFSKIVQMENQSILGLKLEEFEWSNPDDMPGYEFPWVVCQEDKKRVCGEIVQLRSANMPVRKFVVNATPIRNGNATVRGALVSFDDVTAIENKNAELGKMIHTLRSSRDEVERQNEQLSFLASYDPLTKCLNRRAFFGEFESNWESAVDGELAVMMLDVDHFKAVNDNHGHSVGDEVLRFVGKLLHQIVGDKGMVCRYGGEEFVVLIPGAPFDEALELAELIRQSIEQDESTGIKFTASIGVSRRSFGSMDAQHMLDQADECLFIAKRHGRNQVVRFDERSNYVEEDADEETIGKEIPYSAVTGLLSALSFRCQITAHHSIRVADLCVAIGEQMMNTRDLYRLEVAALLHDIGKIGVPDVILNKPGPLTPEEWKVMRKHDQIGVEIVRSAFGSDRVAGVIESHHYCFNSRNEIGGDRIDNDSIPLAGRIITVCDAFDAMTHERVYRKAIPAFDALEEIIKHTPEQFDPEVVKQLVIHVKNGHDARQSMTEPLRFQHQSQIGMHIESLYAAIETKDVARLRGVVEALKHDGGEPLAGSKIAERLDEAINNEDRDLAKVLLLATEVMEVCRTHRTSVSDEELADNTSQDNSKTS